DDFGVTGEEQYVHARFRDEVVVVVEVDLGIAEFVEQPVLQAVERYQELKQVSSISLTLLFASAGLGGLFLGYRRVGHLFPAREKVEVFVRGFLLVSSISVTMC
ncbi:MAG: hypothetical protein P8Z67_14890, partial [Gammaproteobacteria bacterium]